MVLPHPDLPIINPLISLGSRGDYIVCWGFHSKRDFLLPFFIFIIFFICPYIKNVLFKVSTCNINWKYHYCYVQKWRTNEARPMHRTWKTKTQFIKRDVTGGSFLNTLVNKLPFEMHLPENNLTGPGTKLLYKIEFGWNVKGV